MIPFAAFEPDKSPFNVISGDTLQDVLPVADGWGPLPDLTEVSGALPGECLGAIAIQDSSNTTSIFAGTETNLYQLNTSTSPFSWDEKSKTTDVYAVPTGDRWSFVLFGNSLIASQLGNPMQSKDITGSGNFADLAGSPPNAKHIWISGDFLVAGWLTNDNNTIQWSALNDPTSWITNKRGSGKQTFPDGGGVMAGIGDATGSIIVFRDKIRRMQFAPTSGYTFTFQDISSNRGAIAPYSVVEIGPNDFVFLAKDGFYRGVQGQPIGAERVNKWFYDELDAAYVYDVRGVADPFNKVVWWRFRKVNGEGVLIGYDWQLDRWCYSSQDTQHAFSSVVQATSWDGLDNDYPTIDDVNVPFDSRLFKGGAPTFAAFTTDSKLAYFTGANRQAVLRTAQVEQSPGNRTLVNGARAVTDSTNFTGRVGALDHHGDMVDWSASTSLTTRSQMLDFRTDGRLHIFEITIPAGEVWTIATGVRPDAVVTGEL